MKNRSLIIKIESDNSDLKSLVQNLTDFDNVDNVEILKERKNLGAFDSSFIIEFSLSVGVGVASSLLTDLIKTLIKKGKNKIWINKKKLKEVSDENISELLNEKDK